MTPNTGSALSSLECHLLVLAGAVFAGTLVFVLVTEETSTTSSSSSFFTMPMGLMRFARLEEGVAVGDAAVTEEGSTLPGDLHVSVLISTFASSECAADGVLDGTGTGEDRVEGGEGEDDDGGTLKKLFALATSIYRSRSRRHNEKRSQRAKKKIHTVG